MPELRISGQKDNRTFLVLTESKKAELGVGYIHNCGTEILTVPVSQPVWGQPEPKKEKIPYCPKCETVPSPTQLVIPLVTPLEEQNFYGMVKALVLKEDPEFALDWVKDRIKKKRLPGHSINIAERAIYEFGT